jgi:hypothetical protein
MTEEEMIIYKQETDLKIENLEKELTEKNEAIEKLKEHNQKLFYSASALQEKQEKQEEQAKQEQAKQEEKFDLNGFINKKRGRK